jgi:hypothetical protein
MEVKNTQFLPINMGSIYIYATVNYSWVNIIYQNKHRIQLDYQGKCMPLVAFLLEKVSHRIQSLHLQRAPALDGANHTIQNFMLSVKNA